MNWEFKQKQQMFENIKARFDWAKRNIPVRISNEFKFVKRRKIKFGRKKTFVDGRFRCNCTQCRTERGEVPNPKTFENPYVYGRKLMKKGYVKLGSGAYSTVYGKEGSDKVIRVTRRLDNWIEYARWGAREGYSGSFAPRVYSYKLHGADTEEPFAVSVVERLDKTSSSLDAKDDRKVFDQLFSYYVGLGNEMAGLMLNEAVPGIYDFGKKLKKTFQGQRLDLHGGNFMVRSDGSFVLVDPLCNDNNPPVYKRLKTKDFTSEVAA